MGMQKAELAAHMVRHFQNYARSTGARHSAGPLPASFWTSWSACVRTNFATRGASRSARSCI